LELDFEPFQIAPGIIISEAKTAVAPVLSHWQPVAESSFFMMRELTPNPAVLPGKKDSLFLLQASLLEYFSFQTQEGQIT